MQNCVHCFPSIHPANVTMERANDLRRSAAAGDMDAVRRLVAAGADVNQATNNGRTLNGMLSLIEIAYH